MKKKILLAILIVVILLGVGGAYAYFATDAFKSNKELFLSYLFDGLKDEKLEEYIKKQENESYTNNGKIEITAKGEDDRLDEAGQEKMERLIDRLEELDDVMDVYHNWEE